MAQRFGVSDRWCYSVALSLAIGLAHLSPANAWQSGKVRAPNRDKASKDEAEELPSPIDEKIEVKNDIARLTMRATYYPSNLGKAAIPVLLLHGFEGTRSDYAYLAEFLHQQGHAVIVPDLRGHGDSTAVHLANGKHLDLSAKAMTPRDFEAIVRDLDAVKSWLLARNNAEELNMESLVVVGADMSTVTAMNFALRDWEAPELLNYKNCKDVKAVIMLSPQGNYRGTSMKVALKHLVVGHKLSVLIAVGKKDAGELAEAKRLTTSLERQHGEATAEKRQEDKEVVFYAADTNLQGTALVQRDLNVAPIIGQFIKFRVQAMAEDFVWSARIKP